MRLHVVGAGISGATITRSLAESGCIVQDAGAKSHVGGHCHTERDAETGIMRHVHGPHILHSGEADVWHFVSRFEAFNSQAHACVGERLLPMPINLETLEAFFGREFTLAQAHVATRRERSSSTMLPATPRSRPCPS